MANESRRVLHIERKFDPRKCRHTFNGETAVLHCHHFTSLYTQLADDAQIFDGKVLLMKAAELSFHPILGQLFGSSMDLGRRLAIIEDYWRFTGMGTLTFEKVGACVSTARMDNSHVDEGWVKKFGKRDASVNFIGEGYLAAAMAAVYDLPPGSYEVHETQSIVSGAPTSRFTIIRK